MPINVKHKAYHVTGDGITDDSAGISEAWGDALDARQPLYFPSGTYRVTQNNIIGSALNGWKRNRSWIGDGPGQSEILFQPDDADGVKSLYARTSPADDLMYFHMRDLTVQVSDANAPDMECVLFEQDGQPGAPNQSFTHERCYLYGTENSTLMDIEGVANGDSNYFSNCRIHTWKTVLKSNNTQAVNHQFVNTNILGIKGDMFVVDKGSNIEMFGGSVILDGDEESEGSFLRLNAGPTGITGTFLFQGIRVEFHGKNKRLVDINGFGAAANICFQASAFRTVLGGPRYAIRAQSYSRARINFRDCEMSPDLLVEFKDGLPGYWKANDHETAVTFDTCINMPDLMATTKRGPLARGRLVTTGDCW